MTDPKKPRFGSLKRLFSFMGRAGAAVAAQPAATTAAHTHDDDDSFDPRDIRVVGPSGEALRVSYEESRFGHYFMMRYERFLP